MWFKRDISYNLSRDSSFVQILTGPRQCGKSSLLLNLDPSYVELNLDDLALRETIKKDPVTFLSQLDGKKVLIDEAHLAPEIFSAIKLKVDHLKRKGVTRQTLYRITGSNQILMDKNVKESLAGRASYFELNTFSVAEIYELLKLPMSEILFKGGWPEIYSQPSIPSKRFLDDYIRSYIEKDIVLTAGIQKQNEFMQFLKLLAGRTGQLLNASELSKEVGVSGESIRDWISILERMKIILLVPPYFSNISKRLVKMSKVYFLDTGLAVRLQGHSEIQPLLTSPQIGPLFETLVCAEIYKTLKNFDLDWRFFHWRSRDGEEVDFLLEKGRGEFIFIEAKVTHQSLKDPRFYPEIRKVFGPHIPPITLCHLEGAIPDGKSIPVSKLRDFLLNKTTLNK